MAPAATSVFSAICTWLYGDSHLLEERQALGQDATWRAIYFAQQFTKILLTANAGYTAEKKDKDFLTVPKQVIYKLEHLYKVKPAQWRGTGISKVWSKPLFRILQWPPNRRSEN